MKLLTIFLTFSIMMASALYAETSSAEQSFTCKVTGGITVDSLFRAIPPDKISMEPEGQKAKPTVLDLANGYVSLSYKIQSQTIKGEDALGEVCTTFSWDIKKGIFVRKK